MLDYPGWRESQRRARNERIARVATEVGAILLVVFVVTMVLRAVLP